MMFLLQVSYVLKGQFRHEDFCGHKGIIGPGDLQVMYQVNLNIATWNFFSAYLLISV